MVQDLLGNQMAWLVPSVSEFVCSVAQSISHFMAPWTVAHSRPASMKISRQEYCSGVSFPSRGSS